jgi:hypothetical protein
MARYFVTTLRNASFMETCAQCWPPERIPVRDWLENPSENLGQNPQDQDDADDDANNDAHTHSHDLALR